MKHETRIQTVTKGELIAALYDETEKVTNVKKFQTLLVALALLDLRRRVIKMTKIAA
ncbi:MAG TPA: hypothetical protein VLH08_00665 [Acidobacteriota bacterium]|jgi:hypothetical protein|nr:hypothetical protein [Acidobacteriota bacterium]